VSAQQGKSARGGRRVALALLWAFGGFKKQSAQIGIAHAVKDELGATDGSQQLVVALGKRVESAIAATPIKDRSTDSGYLVSKWACTANTSKGLEITIIGLMGNLGTAVEIGHTAAQFTPPFFTFFIAFFGPLDLELFGMNDGGFRT
jgi:hypothetical protein